VPIRLGAQPQALDFDLLADGLEPSALFGKGGRLFQKPTLGEFGPRRLEPERLHRVLVQVDVPQVRVGGVVAHLVGDHRLGRLPREVVLPRVPAPRHVRHVELEREDIERAPVPLPVAGFGQIRQAIGVVDRPGRIQGLRPIVELVPQGEAVVHLVPHAPGEHRRVVAEVADGALPRVAVELQGRRLPSGAVEVGLVGDGQLGLDQQPQLVGDIEVLGQRDVAVMPDVVEAELLRQ